MQNKRDISAIIEITGVHDNVYQKLGVLYRGGGVLLTKDFVQSAINAVIKEHKEEIEFLKEQLKLAKVLVIK